LTGGPTEYDGQSYGDEAEMKDVMPTIPGLNQSQLGSVLEEDLLKHTRSSGIRLGYSLIRKQARDASFYNNSNANLNIASM